MPRLVAVVVAVGGVGVVVGQQAAVISGSPRAVGSRVYFPSAEVLCHAVVASGGAGVVVGQQASPTSTTLAAFSNSGWVKGLPLGVEVSRHAVEADGRVGVVVGQQQAAQDLLVPPSRGVVGPARISPGRRG